jgi:hypothetical protein
MSVFRGDHALNSNNLNDPSQPNSPYPIAQYAHVDATQPEGSLSFDNRQIFSPPSSTVEPPSAVRTKAQALPRTTRPPNAFMLYRSEFVKHHKHVEQRQQELSIMSARAWRALGIDGQTEWYEKAALAKGQYDIKATTSQRPKPYRPRVNSRNVARTDVTSRVRDTYATYIPALSARLITRNSVDEPLSQSPLSVQDVASTVRSLGLMPSSSLAHASSFFAGHHYHYVPEEAVSPSVICDVRSNCPTR